MPSAEGIDERRRVTGNKLLARREGFCEQFK